MADPNPLVLAERLLRALRDGAETGSVETRLADLDSAALADALGIDRERVAFWLNVHNASVQLLLLRDPRQYDRRFFARDQVPVANEWISLDDIVHGILRRSRWKYGLGYVPRPFVDPFERVHRVDRRDWRVHAALNRGTVDCPPVAVYEPDRIDEQLDAAAASYLRERVRYDPAHDRVRVPRRLLAHVGDLDGPPGLRETLRSHGVVPSDAEPSIRSLRSDRRLDLGRWANGWGDPDG